MVQRGLSAKGVAWAFTTFRQANWHPLTWISLMADASIGGGAPGAFHIANVVYHAAATILLFLLLVRLTGCEGRSATVALLFAIHPLRVESVVWIAERKDVLSLALGFAALYAWVLWVEKPSRARYATALGLFAAGLLAKPMLVTLPVLMLLLDRWPLDRFDLVRGLREKLPFFALSAASAVVTFVAQSRGGAVAGLTHFPLSTRAANACVAAVGLLALVSTAQATLWRDSTTLFAHTIAVTGPNAAAHYALGRALFREGRLEDSLDELRSALAISDRYADALDAYRRAVGEGARDPAVRSKLGAALTAEGTRRMRAGDAAGAESVLREAVDVAPEDATAHATLGVALARAGKLEEAEREIAEAVRRDPSNAGFASNLERIRKVRRSP